MMNIRKDEYKKENTRVLVGNKFPRVPRNHDRLSRGTIHKNNNYFSPDKFLIKLKHHLTHSLLDVPNFC